MSEPAHNFDQYKVEFPGVWEKASIQYPGSSSDWCGRLFSGDEDKESGMFVVNTIATNEPERKRYLYIWSRLNPKWEEVNFLNRFRIKNPLIVHSDRPYIVFEDISGRLPFVDTKLYLYDIAQKSNEEIGCGYFAQVSPDRRKMVFCRSDGKGFNNICYWDIDSRKVRVLFSYTESDPGDGTTIFYRWASDSHVIYFSGAMRSFRNELKSDGPYSQNFFYFVIEDKFIRMLTTNVATMKWK